MQSVFEQKHTKLAKRSFSSCALRASVILLFLSALFAPVQAANSIITATITVTNAPTINGWQLTVNGDIRTWTNNTAGTPASLILTNSTQAGSATNLFTTIAAYPFSAIDLNYSSPTGITLKTHVGGAIAVSFTGAWATLVYTTNTTDGSYEVSVPLSNYANRTNTATRLVDGINAYATNAITAKYSGTTDGATVSNSMLKKTVVSWLFVTNSLVGGTASTNGLIFQAAAASGSTNAYWLVADAFGWPTVHNSAGGSPLIVPEDVNGLVTLQFTEATYPHTGNDAGPGVFANNWNAQNNFYSFRATNAQILAGIFTGTNTNSFYYGTIGNLTNGNIKGSTLTTVTISGTIGALANGTLTTVGLTNATATNSTLVNFTSAGTVANTRTNHTALANGANAAVDFSGKTFVKIKAGPTAAFSIAGISGGTDGRELEIYNSTAQNMTISNDSGTDPTPANRILTNTGADVTTTGAGFVTLKYDTDQSRWVIKSIQL